MNAIEEIVVSNALLVVILAAVIAVVGRFWKNPQGLHLLWLLVLLKFFTPPLLTVPIHLPSRPIAVESDHVTATSPSDETAFRADSTAADSEPTMIRPSFDQEPIAVADKTDAAPLPTPIPWLGILAGLWGIGIAIVASWQAFRILRFHRLLHSAQPASSDGLSMAAEVGKQLGLRRIPQVRMLPVRVSPMVLSVGFRPQLLLPMELFKRLEPTAQRSLLAHELAHIRRKDHQIRLLELLVTTLFWWHPVAWWACWELQKLEDLCCDAMVVGIMPGNKKVYATALMNTLDFLCDGSIAAPLGITATQSSVLLTRRIAMLKNPSGVMRLTAGRVVLLVLVAAVPMSIAFAAKPPQNDDSAAVRHNDTTQSAVASPQTVAESTLAVPKANDQSGKTSATKPADEVSPSNNYSGGTVIATGTVAGGGFAGTTVGGPLLPEPMMSRSHPNDFDFPFYQPLLNDRTRTVLHLSGEQEQKLRELSRKYVAEFRPTERKFIQELDKATANSLPEEKNRKMDELWIQIRTMAKPVRQQVEALLTPEQLAKLRKLALIDRRSAAILVYDFNDPKARARLTKEQKKEIEQLCLLEDQFTTKAYEKIVQADRENDEKAVAILTLPQRAQIERQIREGELGMPIIFGQQLSFQFTTPPGVGHVSYPPLWEFRKELGLSGEQLRKLEAIAVDSRCSQELFQLYMQPPEIQPKAGNDLSAGKAAKNANKVISGGIAMVSGTLIINGKTMDLPRLTPQLEQTMKQPEFRQKVEELKKQFRQQIEVTLTPQQLATLKKLALQKAVARRARDPEIPTDLHPTEQQKTEMYRLEAHADTMHRLFLEGREKFVDAFSPQQREKCFQELERQEWGCW